MKGRSIKISEEELHTILLALNEGEPRNILLRKLRGLNKKKNRVSIAKEEQQLRRNELASSYRSKLITNATKAEKRFRKLLDENNIAYEFQHIYYTEFSFYIIDFFLTDYEIAVEIDGGYHNCPRQKKKDRRRDRTIKHKMLVYSNEQVLRHIDEVTESLMNELDK